MDEYAHLINDNLKRVADALEEILQLVKEDQEKMRKINEEKLEHINLKEKYASLEPDPNDEDIEEEARLKDGDDEVSWSK
jgi:hypothetical protein